MREFDKEGPRAEGSPVVWAGQDDGPALVVIDPSGAARHDELPPTWDKLAEHFQIAWCRIPASRRSIEDVEDVLETLTERRAPTSIVASGESCSAAVAIAQQFSDVVSVVLLVDPPEGEDVRLLTQAGESDGLTVRVAARSNPGPSDRVEPPIPLGHPEVVDNLTSALATLT